MFTDNTQLLELDTPLKPITGLTAALEDLGSYNDSIQLAIGHDAIALEMINFSDAVGYLKKLTKKVGLVHSLTKEKVEFAPTIEVLSAKYTTPSKNFLETNFAEVRRTQIYKPTGLSGYFVELLSWLEDYQELFSTLPKTAMNPFTQYLRDVIQDPTELRGIPKEMTKLDNPDTISKEAGKLFKAADGVDVGEMGQLLRRMKDIPEVAERLEKVTTCFNQVGREDVIKSIDVVLTTLEELMTLFKVEGYQPSKKFVATVADHVTKLAKLSAAYSLYTTKLLALSKAMEDNVDRFKEIEANLKK